MVSARQWCSREWTAWKKAKNEVKKGYRGCADTRPWVSEDAGFEDKKEKETMD
jgi:hypothetical protein